MKIAIALLTAVALAACVTTPTKSAPRADATDATWTPAVTPAGFDAGSGSGGF